MKKTIDKFVVYGLRETYHELGAYEIKIVLNPKFFKNGHEAEVQFNNSDGNPMKYEVKKWGRKINCTFLIDKDAPDGVSIINLLLKDGENGNILLSEQFSFWIIKP